METIFVANVLNHKTEGIYKKICAEAAALGKAAGKCTLVTKSENGCVVTDTSDWTEQEYNEGVLKKVKALIAEKRFKIIYIRLMVPDFALISLMKEAHQNGIKVYYEIPTYPYYAEQFRTSRKKYRAVAKITMDFMFSPLIHKYADHIVTIKSNSRIKMHKKMVEITNGVKIDNIKAKSYANAWDGVFRMVAVGTLYPYHGYDRVLKGLKQCHEEADGVPVEFHIVGSSYTIDQLKKAASDYGLKRVVFHGIKTTDELNEMYEAFDVGLGCLALHRRNADIDTTLKIIEYYCRGIPAVTSGTGPYRDASMTITVPDNEEAVDIGEIYSAWKKIPRESLLQLSEKAKRQFDWNTIFNTLMQKTNTNQK
ncbi:Glycosyltransferase involved in cell wall bisynthesis [Ruminococcaceae bacterium P7]|nr:Glycosyltransferase involved in cell wall bisynthesis [Ruminococcaceae bacterium P7]